MYNKETSLTRSNELRGILNWYNKIIDHYFQIYYVNYLILNETRMHYFTAETWTLNVSLLE